MKQLAEITEFVKQASLREGAFAMALLFSRQGSSYRRTGARMVVHASGSYAGGISGGCLEDDIRKKAILNLHLNRSEIIPYATKKNNSPGANLGCDGKLEVLVHPVNNEDPFNPVNVITRILDSRKPEVICTVVRLFQADPDIAIGSCFLKEDLEKFCQGQPWSRQLEDRVAQMVKNGNSGTVILNSAGQNIAEFFIEIIQPRVQLIIVGNHRDVLPMATFSETLGWKTMVCGRKNEHLEKRCPTIRVMAADHLAGHIDPYTAVVFISHDFDADVINLPKVIEQNAFYIGVLGPEKRKQKLLETIGKIEFSAKIAGPIGINIGSQSPEEIALATCAEIQLKYSSIKDIQYGTGSHRPPSDRKETPISLKENA
jgi:xanthine dehydrogenase accessory factor